MAKGKKDYRTHKCEAEHCAQIISLQRLFCPACEALLPEDIRNDMNSAIEVLTKKRKFPDKQAMQAADNQYRFAALTAVLVLRDIASFDAGKQPDKEEQYKKKREL